MGPYITKATIHHSLEGLAGGDEDGNARSDDYIEALDDVRDALDIDIDEDELTEGAVDSSESQ